MRLIRAQQRLKVIERILLTDKQRALTKFHRAFHIADSSTDSSGFSSGGEIEPELMKKKAEGFAVTTKTDKSVWTEVFTKKRLQSKYATKLSKVADNLMNSSCSSSGDAFSRVSPIDVIEDVH